MANAKALTKTPEATTGTAPNDSIFSDAEKVNSYSIDDALLVESDPDYADTLSGVREDARRYSVGKSEERISNFDGRIKGCEEAVCS